MAIADNQMLGVETVSGAVAATELGPTLLGEHIVLAPAGHGYWPLDDDRAERVVGAAADALGGARAAGIETVVDVTPIESGRDAALLARIAERAHSRSRHSAESRSGRHSNRVLGFAR